MEITTLNNLIFESSKIGAEKEVFRSYFHQISSTTKSKKLIKVLTGLRRSGKSFILKQIYKKLLDEGVPKENILFINFENDLLASYLDTLGLRKIFKTFEIHSQNEFPKYVFLDEIQNVKNWHKLIRTLYDQEKYNFYLTGSNSNLLSGEIATVLGGRVIEFEIKPFNFEELANIHGLNLRTYSEGKDTDLYLKITNEILHYGALPESIEMDKSIRQTYKNSLVDKIIINDILKRYQLESPEQLRNILIYLEKSLGGIISFNNLSKNNVNISVGTISNYVEYLTQSFLIFPIKKYHFQAKEILNTQNKFYFVDNVFCMNSSLGGQLENLVATELVRKYSTNNVFFARNDSGKEVDFIILDQQGKIIRAIQIAYELTEDNFKRESSSLKLMKNYNRNTAIQYELIYKNSSLKSKIKNLNFINIVSLEEWFVKNIK